MSYKEQLQRTYRWLERLEAASSHQNLNEPLPAEKRDEYEDFLYAFFQNCWHIKGWITGDKDAPEKLRQAVKPIDETSKIIPLALCAGVANGSKHLGPARDPRRRAKTVGEIEVDIDPQGDSQTTYKYKVVDSHGNSHDAIKLARQALQAWETIIKDNSE